MPATDAADGSERTREVADSDWSTLNRNTYSRNGRDDYRLMAVCDAAGKMIAGGAKEAEMQFPLDKLDVAMAKCDARRVPAPKP